MKTYQFEAWHGKEELSGGNWGKFMVGVPDEEWSWTPGVPGCAIPGLPLLDTIGWTARHIWVCDLQTGEGAFFKPGGYVHADLDKHRIWVCPLFEPWLIWLYEELEGHADLAARLEELPRVVELPDAGFAFSGYRRPGPVQP